jgi:nitroreductase
MAGLEDRPTAVTSAGDTPTPGQRAATTNDVIDALMTTRAIRRFSDTPVSDEQIEACLRAAQQAPSGGNVQPQQYVVLTDADQKAKVADLYRSAFDRYERSLADPTDFRDEAQATSWRRTRDASRHLADHLADAPAIVVFLQPLLAWTPFDDAGPMDIGRLDASVYPAVQNFCVAARSLGLGTTLTTVIRIHGADVLDALGVPAGSDGSPRYEVAALVPVGFPAGRFGVAPRKPAAAVTHWNRWGNKRR